MKWRKAPDELKGILDLAMQGIDAEKRLMFGFPAYFINANMFIGLFEDKLFIRLSDELREATERRMGALKHLEPMPGRPMKDYLVLPQSFYSKQKELEALIAAAAVHARSLPAKVKKAGPKKPGSKT
ncbi:MAG: TfoX/Sxy family protein [Spirochaetes bacterium]|nr:TfoX/Sxy family protein [Spirochaetota bacterium]